MVYCVAVDCHSSSNKPNTRKIFGSEQPISFFRLPSEKKDKVRRQTWLNNIKRPIDNLPPLQNVRLCTLHFTEDQFDVDLKVKNISI